MNGLVSLLKMATVLGKDDDFRTWNASFAINDQRIKKSYRQGQGYFQALGALDDYTRLVYAGIPDEWAEESVKLWLLNSDYGFMPPNDTWAAPLAAASINSSKAAAAWQGGGPWLAHSTFLWETVDGLYRHHAGEAANTIALGHTKAMQRTYGFTIFPEAWDAAGLPWGDQWYIW